MPEEKHTFSIPETPDHDEATFTRGNLPPPQATVPMPPVKPPKQEK